MFINYHGLMIARNQSPCYPVTGMLFSHWLCLQIPTQMFLIMIGAHGFLIPKMGCAIKSVAHTHKVDLFCV